jgi:hypothetical protein
MLFHSASNQLLSKHPLVTLGDVLFSLGSMAEVLHDAIDTRLKVGKLEEVMDLWEWDAEKIDGTCDKLLGDLHVIRKQLGGKSEALDEYEAPHNHS